MTAIYRCHGLVCDQTTISLWYQNCMVLMTMLLNNDTCAVVLSESVPLVMSRTLITHMIECMRRGLGDNQTIESQKSLCEYIIQRIQPRAVSYEEPLMTVCEYLSTVYQGQQAWSAAADTLARIDVESGMRVVDSAYKLGNCIKIARLYLEDGKVESADVFLKKASSLLTAAATGEVNLMLQYQACSAMILERREKFTEASVKYYDLSSQLGSELLAQKVSDGSFCQFSDLWKDGVGLTRQDALECAILCALVAAAGPQRSRLLSMLHKDEDCVQSPLYEILDKVYLERLLLSEDVERFSTLLKTHSHALVDSQHMLTVLDKAVIEHNLEACSTLYTNITFSSLAQLLRISPEKAEDIVATMIRESRLPAEIDQMEDMVMFHHDPVSPAPTAARTLKNVVSEERRMNQIEEALRLADRALALAAKR